MSRKEKQEIAKRQSMGVYKGNELIQKSRFDLTNQQQKLLIHLISKIKKEDEPNTPYRFSITEFCKDCGYDYTQPYYYESIKADLKKMRDTSFWIDTDDGYKTTVGWLSKAKIREKSGIIYVEFDRDLTPYLFQLKENFTAYCIENILAMKGKYSIRLYELLKSYLWQGNKKKFELEELRIRTGAETYDKYYDFKRFVLEPSQKEINKYSDINIDYEEFKDGRAVKYIEFKIKKLEDMGVEEVNTRRNNRGKVLKNEI